MREGRTAVRKVHYYYPEWKTVMNQALSSAEFYGERLYVYRIKLNDLHLWVAAWEPKEIPSPLGIGKS